MNFAMSVAEFDQHKQNAYMAAVAKAAGRLVQFSDIELVIASISSTAQLATANPSRRRLLQDDTVGRRKDCAVGDRRRQDCALGHTRHTCTHTKHILPVQSASAVPPCTGARTCIHLHPLLICDPFAGDPC